MTERTEPREGFCAHRSTGRNCPISKTPCLGECIYANILEDISLGIIGVDTSRKEIFFENKLAIELLSSTMKPRDYEALTSLLLAERSDGGESKTSRTIRYGPRFLGYTVYRISAIYFWILLSDITEKERLNAHAQAVNTMNNLGYMVSGIRHELGNPINSIKTAVTVLKDNFSQYTGDVVAEFLDRVLADVGRVETLLRDLKTFSIYETADLRNVNLPAFLDDLLSYVTNDFASRGIRVKSLLRPDAEWGLLDPRALKHVMLNIFTNAMDALKGREVPQISIGLLRANDRIIVTVKDNGCGIPEDFKHHLFKPFFTTKKNGTGLGLVIMRNMMTKMGGTIEIDSREGVETTLTLNLPAGKAPAAGPTLPLPLAGVAHPQPYSHRS